MADGDRDRIRHSDLVKDEYADLEPIEILDQPVTALIGVSNQVGRALGDIGIRTVRDLAMSSVFNFARSVVLDIQQRDQNLSDGVWDGRASRDRIDAEDLSVESVAAADISNLIALDQSQADALRREIAVATVRELGLWPPFLNARAILASLTGDHASDPRAYEGIPDELVPVMRTYATDRVSYKRLFYDHELSEHLVLEGVESVEDAEELSVRPVDVTAPPERTTTPAVGAFVEVVQEWVPQGVSLGSLLHSVTLAPGESTRIAMLDWSRTEKATTEDIVSQAEALEASRRDNRAIGEIQRGTISQAYGERSRTDFDSTTTQEGYSQSSSPVETLFAGSSGYSHAESQTEGFVSSVGSSYGRRNVAQEMTQTVHQASQQAASSVRSARATIVTETAQGEEIAARTRMVTNYNHMHALSMHYYEVVQVYRVATRPSTAKPVLFIPFEFVDFTDAAVIDRHRSAIASAGLNPYVSEVARAFTRKLQLRNHLDPGEPTPNQLAHEDEERRALGLKGIEGSRWSDSYWVDPGYLVKDVILLNQASPALSEIIVMGSMGIEHGRFEVDQAVGRQEFSLPEPVLLKDVSMIQAVGSIDEGDIRLILSLERGVGVNRMSAELPVGGAVTAGLDAPGIESRHITVLSTHPLSSGVWLSAHLMRNQLYYSQAIWTSLRPSEVQAYLGDRTIDHLPVSRLIDATPIAVYGNLVAFRLNIPEDTDERPIVSHLHNWWSNWTDDLPFADRVAITPVPTGGVHAEAILGRANAAEKLDISRFWDWQESPIPLVAPEIEAVGVESRARELSALSQGFADALVGLQNAPDLPAPAGLEAMASILTTSGIFSQLSSMAANAALASQLAESGQEGAQVAAEQATEANRIAAEMLQETLRTAASLYAASSGVPSQGSASDGARRPTRSRESQTNSGFGARFNALQDEASHQTGSAQIDEATSVSSSGQPDGDLPQADRIRSDGASAPRRALEADLGIGEPYRTDSASRGSSGDSDSASQDSDQFQLVNWVDQNNLEIGVMFRAFIPYEAVWVPDLGQRFFGGDSRSFQAFGGTHRSQIVAKLTFDDAEDAVISVDREWGLSTEYSGDDVTEMSVIDFWAKLKPNATPTNTERLHADDSNLRADIERPEKNKLVINIVADGVLPLMPWAPAVTADITLELERSEELLGLVRYRLSGTHDAFPSYELYVVPYSLFDAEPVPVWQREALHPVGLTGVLAPPVDLTVAGEGRWRALTPGPIGEMVTNI